jgi:hypothetical protein
MRDGGPPVVMAIGSPLRIETLDELLEIIEGVAQDIDLQALGWAVPHLERLATELRESEPGACLHE